MDQQTATLYAEAVLGADADDFFKTDIGRYILARSKEDIGDATEKLKNIEFYKSKEIADLQMDIKKAEGAIIWLNEVLITGKEAVQLLEEGD